MRMIKSYPEMYSVKDPNCNMQLKKSHDTKLYFL
jgi:hypothetical protein